jgi:hypothetical protein
MGRYSLSFWHPPIGELALYRECSTAVLSSDPVAEAEPGVSSPGSLLGRSLGVPVYHRS